MSLFNSPKDEALALGRDRAVADGYIGSRTGVFSSPFGRRLFVILACAVLFITPFLYLGNYAGDSQVHLIYGENAAEGHFFEFNPGEKSPGVTSPGYMLFIAALFKVAPDLWVPAIVKATNLLFWYGLVALVFFTARRLLRSTVWAWVATLAAGLIPGSAYNATIGMENGIFGFVVLLWIYLAMKSDWFTPTSRGSHSIRNELILGLLMGLAAWVRPEGFIVAAVALSYRGMLSMRHRPELVSTGIRSAVFLAPFVTVGGLLAYFHFSQTGELLPTSGNSRLLLSNLASDTFRLGPLFFSPKFTIRLAEYFPLALLWLAANWLFITNRGDPRRSRNVEGFLIVLFWSAFVLYSTVLGSVHLARYIIFVIPALVLTATAAAQWLWVSWRPVGKQYLSYLRILIAAVFIVGLLGVFTVEANIRRGLDSQASLWKTMKAPSERQAFSDALYNQLGRPQKLPISIALQEVQARYWLDDRFTVRSLDGRVDPVLLDHATRVSIDHAGYLKERSVDFLLAAPNYNRDREIWSLARLMELNPGESVFHRGLKFSRIARDVPVQAQAADGGIGEWPWFVGSDGATVLRWFLEAIIRVDHEGT